MRKVAYLIAAFVIGSIGFQVLGQEGDPKDSLQKALNGQFALTQITNDRSDIVSAGAVLVLQKGGLMMYWTASPMPPLNTYKDGKISQGGRGFGRDLLITMATPGNSTASDYPHRQFVAGEKLWVTALGVQKGGIVFNLYSDPYDGLRYYGQLKLPFEKGSVPTPDQAMARIAEVLTVQQAAPPEPEPPLGGPQTPLSGVYLRPQSGLLLQLNTDGSFCMHLPTGKVTSSGHFTVDGDTLVLTYLPNGNSFTFRIQGDKICTNTGAVAFVRQGDSPAPPVPAAPPVAAIPPLKLPSTYVNAQTPGDQLQLNADNSFALQEAGETYHGIFAVSGSTLELNISENSTKTTVTIQGNNLTDGSGQTWTLREQSAGTAPSGAMLQNEDVIKMAKAGFDDAIIIAKISSSKCQFDTSADALILLKKSGVSMAVIKAMIGAGK